MNKTESSNKANKATISDNKEESTVREQQLANDLQLISMLRESPDFFLRHPELLAVIDVAHDSGRAVSLIERQVTVLRQQIQTQDERLCELMDVARDNERLAKTRHSLALNLFSARDLDDVVSIVLDTLKNELAADFAVVKLFTDDQQRIALSTGLFVDAGDEELKAFKIMLEQKNTVCGKATKQQKAFLFGEMADDVTSAAIIPLVAGANLGLIGLGANNTERFKSSMGTDFLSQTGELISASLAVHLEN